LPLRGEHAETSHRRPTDDPSRTPGATPCPAPPGEPTAPTPPARRIPPRPRRWATAVAALIDLQDEYRAWLDNLPTSLDGSRLAEKLHAIAELDLDELQAIDPPRGYGRD
jgi:hypothetical protein